MSSSNKRNSVLKEVLKAFLPYSRNNLALAFSPNKFFNDLERKTGATRSTLSATLSRAKKNKLLRDQGRGYVLSWRGKVKADYSPTKLSTKGNSIVIFDIPEARRRDRYQLRCYLRMMKFKPIQKSVWASLYVVEEELFEVIEELNLHEYVKVFQAEPIYKS